VAMDPSVVNARILYWGVSGAGKSANLAYIHGKLRPDHRGALERVASPEDPAVAYEVMPIELGRISGVRTRLQIVAPPGAPEQSATRQQLLDEVDGIVFVVDARRERVSDNLAALEELRSQLERYGRRIEEVPVVLQYNHRDETDDLAVEELHRKLGLRAAAFEAIAPRGIGVLESLTTISKRVVRNRRTAAGLTQPPGGASVPPGGRVAPLQDPAPVAEALAPAVQPHEHDPGSTLPEESTLPETDEAQPRDSMAQTSEPQPRGAMAQADEAQPRDSMAQTSEPQPRGAMAQANEAQPRDSMAQALDVAARRAERVFDDHWDQATGGHAARTAAPGRLELQVVGAGAPVVEEGRRVRIALTLVDQDGRQGDCVLTLDLSGLRSD